MGSADVPGLRSPDKLVDATKYLLNWLRGQANGQGQHGTNYWIATLNFLRGGETAYNNSGWFPGRNHPWVDALTYRNAIATIYKELLESASQYNDGHDLHQFPEAQNLYHNNMRVSVLIQGE